ncbi:MAG: aspartate/glutamate racemase family protein [Candidatus Asgardarchaeia archaeon]
MSKVFGGKNTYGETIGIIMQKRIFPRVPGDIGNAWTFNFPVKYHVLQELDYSTRMRVFDGDKEFVNIFIKAAKKLEEEGVRAITAGCGFIVSYQDVISDSVNIPVFTSSLLQIPLIYKMLKKDQKIGIITADASAEGLRLKHLKAAGAENIPVVIKGIENSEGFKAISENRDTLDVDLLIKDLVNASIEITKNHSDVRAILLECVNMPLGAKTIQEKVNLPVFDVVTLTNWVYSALVRKEFLGTM